MIVLGIFFLSLELMIANTHILINLYVHPPLLVMPIFMLILMLFV